MKTLDEVKTYIEEVYGDKETIVCYSKKLEVQEGINSPRIIEQHPFSDYVLIIQNCSPSYLGGKAQIFFNIKRGK